jgi:hypothetical protein
MSDDLVARGKALSQSGKYRPDPFGTAGAEGIVDAPRNNGQVFDGVDDHPDGYDRCPACNQPTIYLRDQDRHIHIDGSDNQNCWIFISGGHALYDYNEIAIADQLDRLRIRAEAKRRLDDEQHPPAVPPPVKSLDTLLAEPDTITQFRIDDVAPVDSRIILSAQYKAGKTIIVGNLLRTLVDGDAFLGRFTVNSCARVVLIDDELSENMLRHWLRDQHIVNTGAVADVVSLRGRVGALNLLDDRCRRAWAARLRDLGCEYLILDCLRPVLDALALDEARETGRFLVAFDTLLADAGISDALLIHHMGHANERARGDSRLEDWPDAIWRVVRETDDPTSPRYFSAVGRDVNVTEGRLSYDPDTRRLTFAAGSRSDAKVDAAKVAVITFLADAGALVTVRGIEDALGVDHTRKAIRGAVSSCLHSGVIYIQSGPHGAKLHRITHPCVECGLPVITGEDRHLSCPSKPEELPL